MNDSMAGIVWLEGREQEGGKDPYTVDIKRANRCEYSRAVVRMGELLLQQTACVSLAR